MFLATVKSLLGLSALGWVVCDSYVICREQQTCFEAPWLIRFSISMASGVQRSCFSYPASLLHARKKLVLCESFQSDDPPHAGQSNSSVMTSALRRMGSLLQLGSSAANSSKRSAVGEGQKCSARNSMSAFKACVKSADCSWSSPKCPPSMSSHVLGPLMVSKHCLATTGDAPATSSSWATMYRVGTQAAQRPQAQTVPGLYEQRSLRCWTT